MRLPRPAIALSLALTVALVAAPTASAAGACSAANASTKTASKRALVRATLCVLNAERAKHRLRPLRLNRKLAAAARGHSHAMASSHFFSHNSRNGASFLDRIRRTGYLRGVRSWNVGENIAWGSGRLGTPRSIARAWMNSAGHRANILSRSFRAIGIGIAAGTPNGSGGATYTTDFGRRG
jgi:uncharacterized protein YkwD